MAEAAQHRLPDWLKLHELSPEVCRSLLDAMSELAGTSSELGSQTDAAGPPLDLDTAWRITIDAMRAFFPAQGDTIDLTFTHTQRVLVPRRQGSRRAVTIDNGPITFPTILYSFEGELADLMVLAHEFAHALQIRASGGCFVSPVIREVCAFLGEAALLAHVESLDAMRQVALRQAWNTDNLRYFGVGTQRLASALSHADPAYNYGWNYPVARYLAIAARDRLAPDRLWPLFLGHVTVAALLRTLDLPVT